MKRILFFLFSFSLIQNVYAWGPVGHMIVGQIAQDQLSIKAKNAVDKLLEGQSVAEVSNWADSIKSRPEWAMTKPWHFVDIPDGQSYETIPHSHDGDIITALNEMVNTIKSPKSNLLSKQQALMFVIHFMGDIHQPLHVGRPDDQGGNAITIQFENRKMNLHSLWDSGMITIQQMDYLSYARNLQAHNFLFDAIEATDIPFEQIINENMSVRKQIYMFDTIADAPIILDRVYFKRNIDVMNAQLLSGGKRLATLLNKLFI